MIEEWRPVPGFPYEVSNLGQIRHAASPPLKPRKDPRSGYPSVTLSRRGAKSRRVNVHTLVCEVFHGPKPPGMEVRHLDGTRDNPAADNVKWGTRAENEADKKAHGTVPRGERHGNSRLSDIDVREIRRAWTAHPRGSGKTKEFISKISAQYPASRGCIEGIIYGRSRIPLTEKA